MKTFATGLLVVCCTVLFLSCGDCSKRIDCPGYKDDTLDSWFPYRHNQQLIFRTTNQADTFTLNNIEVTAPYQARGGAFGPSPSCEANKVFETRELDTLKRPKGSIRFSTTGHIRSISFRLNNATLSLYNLQTNGLASATLNGNAASRLLPSFSIGSRTYANVVEVLCDTTIGKPPGIYKLYYAKGEGLLQFSVFPTLQTWTKE